jgi:hypothetical protein
MMNPAVGGIDNVHHQVARTTDEAEEDQNFIPYIPNTFSHLKRPTPRVQATVPPALVYSRSFSHSGSYADSMGSTIVN